MANIFKRFINNSGHPRGITGKRLLYFMNIGHGPISRWGLSQIKWKPDWKVLDIGCGGGANIARMLHECPQGIIHGIDISEVSVAFSTHLNQEELGKRCFIKMGSAYEIPFPDSSMDLVTAFETVYFWGNLESAFAEIRRVLRPGGLFVICNEMSDSSNTRWTDIVEDMVVYSKEELKLTLSESGFSRITIQRRKAEGICIKAYKE